jgi:hypothetical protein
MPLICQELEALHGLVYVSRSRPETGVDMDVTVAGILAAAKPRNAACHVSGALLSCDGWYVQALEGPQARVLETFGRISRDRRHDAMRVLKTGPIAERQFPVWSMCGRRLSPTDDAILSVLENTAAFVPASLTHSKALALLRSVQDLQTSPGKNDVEYI